MVTFSITSISFLKTNVTFQQDVGWFVKSKLERYNN